MADKEARRLEEIHSERWKFKGKGKGKGRGRGKGKGPRGDGELKGMLEEAAARGAPAMALALARLHGRARAAGVSCTHAARPRQWAR